MSCVTRMFKKVLVPALSCLLLQWAPTAYGQYTVSSRLDTNRIRIGEQVRIRLEAAIGKGQTITFPVIGDTLRGLEVVEKSPIDTLRQENGDTIRYKQTINVTAFDSGYFVVEPFIFILNGKDSLGTEAQLLEVKTIPVDTTKGIKDIKPIMDPPFDWKEWIPTASALLAILVIAYLLYRYFKSRKGQTTDEAVVNKPSIPAHIIALQALSDLEKEKLWQQGAYKEYHSRLTEIVRTYIDNRYRISSMEFTTDETVSALEQIRVSTETIRPLQQLLRAADMVKFAKAVPVGPENESSMTAAKEFIHLTKSEAASEGGES